MPGQNMPRKNPVGRFIDIAPDRVPRFRNQSKSDRHLSETLRALQRQFTRDCRREMEDTEVALRRLGFVSDRE